MYFPPSMGFPFPMPAAQVAQQCHLPPDAQHGKDNNDRTEVKYRTFPLNVDSVRGAITTAAPRRLIERHFPERIPPTEKRANPTRQCARCCRKTSENGKRVRKETRYYCPECNVGLCVTPCFRAFHTVT